MSPQLSAPGVPSGALRELQVSPAPAPLASVAEISPVWPG
jgi:hypothetical protein